MRALLLLGTSLAGLALYQAGRTRGAHGGSPAARAPIVTAPAETAPMDVTEVTRNFLMGFVLPLWLAAGIADWICHRATDIEHTTGTKESLMHLAMLVEAAVPVLAGMFLEVTSPVLALMIAAFLLHEATALWDVSYAVTRREVTPIEQHVHSFLEMVPLMAVSFLSVLHWPQLRALVDIREAVQ